MPKRSNRSQDQSERSSPDRGHLKVGGLSASQSLAVLMPVVLAPVRTLASNTSGSDLATALMALDEGNEDELVRLCAPFAEWYWANEFEGIYGNSERQLVPFELIFRATVLPSASDAEKLAHALKGHGVTMPPGNDMLRAWGMMTLAFACDAIGAARSGNLEYALLLLLWAHRFASEMSLLQRMVGIAPADDEEREAVFKLTASRISGVQARRARRHKAELHDERVKLVIREVFAAQPLAPRTANGFCELYLETVNNRLVELGQRDRATGVDVKNRPIPSIGRTKLIKVFKALKDSEPTLFRTRRPEPT